MEYHNPYMEYGHPYMELLIISFYLVLRTIFESCAVTRGLAV